MSLKPVVSCRVVKPDRQTHTQFLILLFNRCSNYLSNLDYSDSKCQVLAKFSFSGREGRRGGVILTTQNSKCQILGESWVEGERVLPRIGYSWQNEQKFCHSLEALASQIVSHTLCVWRLINSIQLKLRCLSISQVH